MASWAAAPTAFWVALAPAASLTNTHWKLVVLPGFLRERAQLRTIAYCEGRIVVSGVDAQGKRRKQRPKQKLFTPSTLTHSHPLVLVHHLGPLCPAAAQEREQATARGCPSALARCRHCRNGARARGQRALAHRALLRRKQALVHGVREDVALVGRRRCKWEGPKEAS